MMSVLPHEEINVSLKDNSTQPIIRHVTCPVVSPKPKKYVPKDVHTDYMLYRPERNNITK